jgi:gas vesicle protein
MTTNGTTGNSPAWAAFLCGALTGAAVALLFAPAAGRETRSRIRTKARDVADSKQAYIARLEAELQHWSAWIDDLATTLGPMSTDAKAELERQLADLRGRREKARVKLEELRTHGGAAWQDLVAGVDRAWQELRQGVENASSRFA